MNLPPLLVQIYDGGSNRSSTIPSQLQVVQGRGNQSQLLLHFLAPVPALGAAVFFVSNSAGHIRAADNAGRAERKEVGDDIATPLSKLSNGNVTLSFDEAGRLRWWQTMGERGLPLNASFFR